MANHDLEAGWPGFEIGRRFPLQAVAESHEYADAPGTPRGPKTPRIHAWRARRAQANPLLHREVRSVFLARYRMREWCRS